MDHLERFFHTADREAVDRPASWLGIPDVASYRVLFDYFGVSSLDELRVRFDDDIYPVELPYHSPTSNAIYSAFDFSSGSGERTLTSKGFFQDREDPKDIEDFDWPDPENYISVEECRHAADIPLRGRAVLGVLWSAHFQDTCAAFGMETALIKMVMEPEIFHAVDEKILEFYLKANEIFYEATRGKIHAVLIGNDLGMQTGCLISPDQVAEFVMPGARRLIEQAHSYGLKVIYHSCGSVFHIIPQLISAGADIIHPIQALAKDMEPERIRDRFGRSVSFCGGVDAQNLLIRGTESEVRKEVLKLKSLFPTGLIISPSHEAILPDMIPGNLETLFKTIKE